MAIRTLPGAACKIHQKGQTDGDGGPKLFADHDGFVRFSLSATGGRPNDADMLPELDCRSSEGTKLPLQPLDFAAASEMAKADLAQQMALPLQPPLSGDPMRPSQQELVAQGHPPRPDPGTAPAQFAKWLDIVTRPKRRVSSVGVPHPGEKKAADRDDAWNGAVIYPPSAGTKYNWIQGTWFVPTLTSPRQNQIFYSSQALWVGLDGPGTNDVVQAGTSHVIYDFPGGVDRSGRPFPISTLRFYGAWIEWYPADAVGVSLAVHPLDQVYAEVWVGDAAGNYDVSGAYCWAYIYNLSTGFYYEGYVGKPSGVTFQGQSAEWILERAEGALADYQFTRMINTVAYATDGGYYDHLNAPSADVWMYNPTSGSLLSANYSGPSDIEYFWFSYY